MTRFGRRPRILTIIAGLVLIAASLELLAQGAPPRNLRIVPPPTAPTTPPPAPPAPSPPRTGLLAPSDLTYLGAMRGPSAAGGSGGALAGRTVGSQIYFFMINRDGEVFEFPYVGQSLDLNTAPIAPVQRAWGWVAWNGNDRRDISWDYNTGAVRHTRTTGNPWPYFGLAYHDNKLYWSYLDYYNTMYGDSDHCVGFTNLSGDPNTNWARGPFRFNWNVKHLCGNLLNTPRGLGLIGSMMAMSRNTDNTWGPSLFVRPYPTMSDAGGYQSPRLSVTPLLDHSQTQRSQRAGDYRPNELDPYNPDMFPSGGQGYWTQRDRMSVAAWIETARGKVGIVFMGGMATGQVWYGSWDAGPHGETNRCRSADRGENAVGFRPEWRIYDPLDLTGSNLRAAPRFTFNPTSLTNGYWSMYACEQYSTGAYYDQASGKLFVTGGWDSSGVPVINVWQVTP